MIKWENELTSLEEKLVSGHTLEELAQEYGVTKQRMQQVKARYFPEMERKDFGLAKRKQKRQEDWMKLIQKRFNRDTFIPSTDLQAAQSFFFTRKRQNVRYQGKWEFSITMSDLDWPDICPVLGLELDWFAEHRKESSPSIDRIDSREGYIPGNVQIVSWRANRIKNNGTAEEHERIAQYIRERQKCL